MRTELDQGRLLVEEDGVWSQRSVSQAFPGGLVVKFSTFPWVQPLVREIRSSHGVWQIRRIKQRVLVSRWGSDMLLYGWRVGVGVGNGG